MWTTVLLVVHLMIAAALVGVVLLQRSEGGALGIGGGGGGFMTGRGTANLLTRMTAVLAGAFFMTSIGLTLLAHHGGDSTSGSVFDRVTVPAPGLPVAPAAVEPAKDATVTAPAVTPATATTPAVPVPAAAEAPKAAEPAKAPEAPRGGVLDKLEQGKGGERLPKK